MPWDASGIGASIAAALGVVSTAIGLWANFENQAIKHVADQQAITLSRQSERIADNDAAIRQRVDDRAEATTARDYTLKVYEKVMDALLKDDERGQQVALALISTLPDATLRERLSSAFQQAPTVNTDVRVQAQQIQQAASVVVAQQKQAQQAIDPSWNYDVFWCTANPANQALAARVQTTLAGGPSRRVRLRDGWTPEMNGRPGYQVHGQEIRAEAGEREQAKAVQSMLEKTVGTTFEIKTISSPTPGYLSVFVCN